MARLEVELIGDSRSLERAFARSEKSAKSFGQSMDRAGRGSLAASVGFKGLGRSLAVASTSVLSGAAVAGFFENASRGASDLNEQISKTNVVFADSAQEVQSWSQTTAAAMGVSQRAALATASSFGALFAPMGLVGQQAADQSVKLTQLGADLASFYNTDVADALDAIRSGIVGESEPLRRYGVLLSETRVQAEGLAETHKKSATDLTAAEKALARITLIMRDTSKAQGDFARTSEELANQSRKLRAEWDDFSTHVGETYVPMLTKLVGAANDAFEAFSGGPPDAPASLKTQAALIPKLADDWGRLRAQGVSAGDAIHQLEDSLGGTGKAAQLVGDAINYFAGGPTRDRIIKLRQQIQGVGVDAETAAKLLHYAGVEAQALAAAAPRGLAALTPTTRAGLRLARAGLTVGTSDDLAALQRQHELNRRAERFAQGRLSGATGKAASRWAENLRAVVENDASVLDRIRGIQGDNAQKQKDAAQRVKDAARKAAESAKAAADAARANRQAAIETRMGWLGFAVERADATKTVRDDLKAQRAVEAFLKNRIRHEGRTLDLVRQLWETRQSIRDLNKKNMDVDPLAGLRQVSSRQLTAILAQGTGLGAAGRRVLGMNIAGAEIQPVHVHVNLDGREVATVVSKQQARSSRRTAKQTSGFRG